MKQQEIFQNMTKGEWATTRYNDGQYAITVNGVGYEERYLSDEEDQANGEAICYSVNLFQKLISQGINPEGVEKMYDTLNYIDTYYGEAMKLSAMIKEALTAAKL
jgi:hypothetical protein